MKKGSGSSTKEPSRSSLREMPEVDFKKAKVRRNPYARRIRAEGISIHVGRGRPSKGNEVGPTVPRSVRFPTIVWEHLERCAKAQGMSLHGALRAAVVAWVNDHGKAGNTMKHRKNAPVSQKIQARLQDAIDYHRSERVLVVRDVRPARAALNRSRAKRGRYHS